MEPSSYCHRKHYSVVNVRGVGPASGRLVRLAPFLPFAFRSYRACTSPRCFRFALPSFALPFGVHPHPQNRTGLTASQSFFGDCFRSSPRPISIGKLHVLPHFHRRPIYLIVSEGSYQLYVVAVFFFRGASRLDAFSVYPVRTSLPCYALGRTTVSPEVRPSRSSRTRDSSRHDSCAHDG